MTLNPLAILSLTTLVTACHASLPLANQSLGSGVSPTPTATITETQITPETSGSGTFVSVAHSTQGGVQIITENGQKYLEFNEAFKTDSGPDLFVLLHHNSPPQSYESQDYVNLGKLQQIKGTQRYAIPQEVNPADFESVVIWCRQFNVTFGYAALNP